MPACGDAGEASAEHWWRVGSPVPPSKPQHDQRVGADPRWGVAGSGPVVVGTVSWRTLLGRLQARLAEHGDVGKAADVEQLAGLADLEDQEAFLPVVPSDLAQPTPLPVHHFMELAEAVCRRGVEAGFLHSEGLRPASSLGRYTRCIGAGPIQLAVFMDLRRWSRQGTPLWVEAAVVPSSAFADLEASTPPGVSTTGPGDVPSCRLRSRCMSSMTKYLTAWRSKCASSLLGSRAVRAARGRSGITGAETGSGR